MKYVIGNDHGGIDLVEVVEEKLKSLGHEVEKVGTFDKNSVDYPDYAKKACKKVVDGEADYAVLICGTGVGMSISANKIKGIRAACVSETFSAKMSRVHNNANCLCIGARVIGSEVCKEIIEAFATSNFEGGRHETRVNKIMEIEEK